MRFFPLILQGAIGVLLFQSAFPAETISSTTTVTPEAQGTLSHHQLEVKCDSKKGMTHVMLYIRAEKEYRLESCQVTVFATVASNPPILASFKVDVTGQPVYFNVADDWVDRVSVSYCLVSDGTRSHVFNIMAGQLRKLTGAGK